LLRGALAYLSRRQLVAQSEEYREVLEAAEAQTRADCDSETRFWATVELAAGAWPPSPCWVGAGQEPAAVRGGGVTGSS
jgi:hypothetical protein